jgi:hypothetical protein
MGAMVVIMEAVADDPVVFHQNGADHGIWVRESGAA